MTNETKTNETKTAETKSNVKTFTTADLASEWGVSAKAARAFVRKHIDKFSELFEEGKRHVYRDNKTVRRKIASIREA